jgi:hypothetical protein
MDNPVLKVLGLNQALKLDHSLVLKLLLTTKMMMLLMQTLKKYKKTKICNLRGLPVGKSSLFLESAV